MPPRPRARPARREELLDLYKIAIEEYRFQVNLNWSRTQYYIALNVGILGVGTGLLQFADSNIGLLVAGIYIAGAVCCCLSFAACLVQQGYYRTARDHKRKIEDRLRLNQLSLATTPGMGSAVRRLGKITTFNNVTLSIIGIVDVVGAVVAFIRWL